MSVKKAIVIGLNEIDSVHYNGWSGFLSVCEADAEKMEAQLRRFGFEQVEKLLTKQATRINLHAQLDLYAKELSDGDLLFIYYSGHGGNHIPDSNHPEQGPTNQSWCLYDAQFIDKELFLKWHQFAPGVTIVLISDSCHSGDIAKVVTPEEVTFSDELKDLIGPAKAITKELGESIYQTHKSFYDSILQEVRTHYRTQFNEPTLVDRIQATVLQIGACHESEKAIAATSRFPDHSLFTAYLLKFLMQPPMPYNQLVARIDTEINIIQTPKCQVLGQNDQQILSHPFLA